jgi:thiol-disulfide isomerase/thioredoxin
LLKYALWGVALIGVAAVLYVIASASFKPKDANSLQSLAHGEMAKLRFPAEPSPPPSTPFTDGAGKSVHIGDFKGQIVVVNLWATWCAPCIKEMPTLAQMAAAYTGKIVVLPISMDSPKDRAQAQQFIAQRPPLAFYQDPKTAIPFAFKPGVEGFPTTIIYGRDGLERARLAGGADWNGPDARAVFDALLSGG